MGKRIFLVFSTCVSLITIHCNNTQNNKSIQEGFETLKQGRVVRTTKQSADSNAAVINWLGLDVKITKLKHKRSKNTIGPGDKQDADMVSVRQTTLNLVSVKLAALGEDEEVEQDC